MNALGLATRNMQQTHGAVTVKASTINVNDLAFAEPLAVRGEKMPRKHADPFPQNEDEWDFNDPVHVNFIRTRTRTRQHSPKCSLGIHSSFLGSFWLWLGSLRWVSI